MKLDDFISKYNGKTVDWDKQYGGQCVDLYRQYCHEVLDFPQSPAVEGAADIWNTYLKNYFIRIANTSEGVPDKGDIVIWSKNTGGGYGHVALFIEGTTGSFRSFDQNWPKGSPCQVVNHYYTNVLGWLHAISNEGADYYKEIDLNNKESIKVCVDIWRDVVDGKYVKKEEYVELQKQLKENDRAWEERVRNEKKQYEDFVRVLAEKLASTQEEPAIIEQITRLIQIEDKINAELNPKIKRLEERITNLARLLEVDEDSIEEKIKELKAVDVASLLKENTTLRNNLVVLEKAKTTGFSLWKFIKLKYFTKGGEKNG